MMAKMDKQSESLLILNLRGTIFQIEEEILRKFPQKSKFLKYIEEKYKISSLKRTEGNFNTTMYINKCSDIFDCILSYFEHNELHFPQNKCISLVEKELEFWGFQDIDLAPCCLDKVLKEKEESETCIEVMKQWSKLEETISLTQRHQSENIQASSTSRDNIVTNVNSDCIVNAADPAQSNPITVATSEKNCRQRMETFLSNPMSSLAAKIWSFFMMILTVLSVIVIMLETETSMRHPSFEEVVSKSNLTIGPGVILYYLEHSSHESWLMFIDIIITLILTTDFIMRFTVSSKKSFFIQQAMSIIDLLGLIPIYIQHIIYFFILSTKAQSNERSVLWQILIYFSLFTVFRLLRFGHIMNKYKTLRTITLAFRRSWKELFILAILLATSSCFFGIIMYIVEIQTEDTFRTVFHAQWWAIVTMTTVGYGDLYPKSGGGYLVGVLCAISGIIVVAIATTILVNNFIVTYENIEKIDRIKKRHKNHKINYAGKVAPEKM